MLGKDSNILDIKILQMVRLIKDGEELKLSKRTGKTITFFGLTIVIISSITVGAYFIKKKVLR